ncbi:MAG: 2-amino-4-hydroxy-6-hydroxymethyldihydropteridine diphosphokinase [Bacteroidetes bacterium]|nr:2-amino-4-hydroxy-6-hydroxymethyldihydropteridine diphosphokinase [Bacteroidota bacterium]
MAESFEKTQKTSAMLSLGSNQGDRLAHLDFAVVSLANYPGIEFVRASSVYETTAHVLNPDEPQPDFLNATLQVMTSLTPRQLLGACLTIEQKRGRQRSPNARWQPRTLDIDILTYDDLCSNEAALTLPHPRLAERRFVLQPLFEIAPDLKIPAPFDQSVQYLLEHCADNAPVDVFPERLAEPRKE